MARSDKRDNLTVSDRPFARVLTAYMWSKQPPWSATRLANALGMGRARVVNWIYHNTDPDLATMLAVMAQLNIPTTTLLRAYEEAGLPTPPLTGDEAAAQPSAQPSTQPSAMPAAQPQQQQLPSASESPPAGEAQTQVDAQDDAQAETDAEWQTMLNHTRLVLRRTGMLDATIEALLSTLDADRDKTRSQGHSSREQRIAEEMDQPAYQAHRPATPPTTPPTTPSRPATKR